MPTRPAKKPDRKPVASHLFAAGPDPRRNTVPPPPGPGRPPDEFRERMRALASREDVLAALDAILTNPNHPQFLRAWQEAADRGYGKAAQHLDVTSGAEQLQHFTLGIGMP